MARIFITGPPAVRSGSCSDPEFSGEQEVIVHARAAERLAALNDFIDRGASAVAERRGDPQRWHLQRPTDSAGQCCATYVRAMEAAASL